jgi:hypothetical protein
MAIAVLSISGNSLSTPSAVQTARASRLTSVQSISDSYTPSQPDASDTSGVPQAALLAWYSYVSPEQQAWNALTQSVKLGDLSSAATELTNYTAALQAANSSPATSPSSQFLSDLTTLGAALQQGSANEIQSAFATAYHDRPDTSGEALSVATSVVSDDSSFAVYGLEHAGSYNFDRSRISGDVASLDSALRQEGSDIQAALVAQGYSRSDAAQYATDLTGIANGSAQDNAAVDASRSSQLIDKLISVAQSGAPAFGVSPTQSADGSYTSNPVSAAIASVLFANSIDADRQLQFLITTTFNAGTSQTYPNPTSSNPTNAKATSISLQA